MIQRYQISEIEAHLKQKEITIIIGARQVGKTTIMQMLQKQILDGTPSIWFNLDFESDLAKLKTQNQLLARIDLEFGGKKGVVFIDEIQRKENAGLFLKGIYDTRPDLKFVVSGSGSLELKEKIVESLAGRKRMFEIQTLSFFEFLDFRTQYRYTQQLPQWIALEEEQAQIYLDEFIQFGSYPAVVLSQGEAEKRMVLQEIIQSYLLRDMSSFIPASSLSSYAQLMKVTALQAGYPIKYAALSQYVQISAPTVKDYLWYMEQTYFVRRSVPYFTNALKEIVKEPCFYFADMGVLSSQRNNNQAEIGPGKGFLFQNFVHNELYGLIQGQNAQLKYWRTKDKAEVDIVLEIGSELIPCEVKYTHAKNAKPTRSLMSFIDMYKPKRAYLIYLSGRAEMQVGDTQIQAIPYYALGKEIGNW